jgi:hypothetical protein
MEACREEGRSVQAARARTKIKKNEKKAIRRRYDESIRGQAALGSNGRVSHSSAFGSRQRFCKPGGDTSVLHDLRDCVFFFSSDPWTQTPSDITLPMSHLSPSPLNKTALRFINPILLLASL